jgi:hypothetical protein
VSSSFCFVRSRYLGGTCMTIEVVCQPQPMPPKTSQPPKQAMTSNDVSANLRTHMDAIWLDLLLHDDRYTACRILCFSHAVVLVLHGRAKGTRGRQCAARGRRAKARSRPLKKRAEARENTPSEARPCKEQKTTWTGQTAEKENDKHVREAPLLG